MIFWEIISEASLISWTSSGVLVLDKEVLHIFTSRSHSTNVNHCTVIWSGTIVTGSILTRFGPKVQPNTFVELKPNLPIQSWYAISLCYFSQKGEKKNRRREIPEQQRAAFLLVSPSCSQVIKSIKSKNFLPHDGGEQYRGMSKTRIKIHLKDIMMVIQYIPPRNPVFFQPRINQFAWNTVGVAH